jgi:PHD/YefM family antitoxin component YafN of YafNO toxin-antitoxin module
MTIIKATALRDNLSETLKEVGQSKKFVLVSHRGRIKSAVVDIDYLEDLLELADENYLKSIREAREQLKRGEYYTLDEISEMM